MEENKKNMQETEPVEYEEVKHLSMGAFVGLGAALGVAIGISVGNLLMSNFLMSLGIFTAAGAVCGVVLGLINKTKK